MTTFAIAYAIFAVLLAALFMPVVWRGNPKRDPFHDESFEDLKARRSLMAIAVLADDPQAADVLEGVEVKALVRNEAGVISVQDAVHNEVEISAQTKARLAAVFAVTPILSRSAMLERNDYIMIRETQPASATMRAAEVATGSDLAARGRRALEDAFAKRPQRVRPDCEGEPA